jgi:hypothetical protein
MKQSKHAANVEAIATEQGERPGCTSAAVKDVVDQYDRLLAI